MLSNATTIGPKTQIGTQIFNAVFDQSLGFRIELPYEQALQFIERIDAYNDFHAYAVLDAIEKVDRIIPRCSFGNRNPNNGQRDYKIEVGREGSPVIYLNRFEFLTDARLTEDQMKAVCQEMTLTGMADEATYNIENMGPRMRKITFRFWWD